MSRDSPTKNFLTVAEAANFAGISRRSVYNFLSDPVRPLPHYRLGSSGRVVRIKIEDLNRWLENFRVGNGCSAELEKLICEITNPNRR